MLVKEKGEEGGGGIGCVGEGKGRERRVTQGRDEDVWAEHDREINM